MLQGEHQNIFCKSFQSVPIYLTHVRLSVVYGFNAMLVLNPILYHQPNQKRVKRRWKIYCLADTYAPR